MLVIRLYPTLCNPVDCSLPDSSVHGIFQARILSGLPFPYPGNLPNPETEPRPPALQADSLPTELPTKPFQIVREPLFLLRAIKSVINCYDRTGVLPQFSKSNISK